MSAPADGGRRIVIANWKMNQTLAEASRFVEGLTPVVEEAGPDVAIAPSFVHLERVVGAARPAGIWVLGQTCHDRPSGAHTGDVSVAMLRDVGTDGVLVGHSERRRDHGERDEVIARKLRTALTGGLRVVLCVGETLADG